MLAAAFGKRGNMRRNVLFVAVVFAISSSPALRAQDKGEIKRKALAKQELASAPGHDAVLSLVELAPGSAEGKHTHPGELLGYVEEGSLTLNVEGKPAATVKRGESFVVPAGATHWGENNTKGPVRIVAALILEKGKPPSSPSK